MLNSELKHLYTALTWARVNDAKKIEPQCLNTSEQGNSWNQSQWQKLMRKVCLSLNPSTYRRFLSPLLQRFLKGFLHNEQFSHLSRCFKFYSTIILSYTTIIHILPRWFQSRLLQICFMWERGVKYCCILLYITPFSVWENFKRVCWMQHFEALLERRHYWTWAIYSFTIYLYMFQCKNMQSDTTD